MPSADGEKGRPPRRSAAPASTANLPPLPVPQAVWQVANARMREAASASLGRKTNGVGGASSSSSSSSVPAVVVRKFRFDAASEEWSGGAEASEEMNLLLTYAALGGRGGNGGVGGVERDRENNGGTDDDGKRRRRRKTKDGGGGGPPSTINSLPPIEADVSDVFLSVSFGDGRRSRGLGGADRSREDDCTQYSYISDPKREQALRRGLIAPDGNTFHLLGCSNSQIRECSFLFRRAKSLKENEAFMKKIIPGIDDLERKKGVAKRVKYAGLLFSGVRSFVNLPSDATVQEIDSFEHPETRLDFTDGCGLMSVRLAHLIKRAMGLDKVPSIVQIRYGGEVRTLDGNNIPYACKGVLLLDPRDEMGCILSFRKSMLKVRLAPKEKSDWTSLMNGRLGILDVGRRAVGKMNQQLTCLLSATVPREELLGIQGAHLKAVEQCWHDPRAAGYLAAMDGSWPKFQDLALQCKGWGSGRNKRIPSHYVTMCQRRHRFCNENGKLQIHLGCSRLLFGASFPEVLHGNLSEGQCLVFTERGLLSDKTVVVSRSPSYCTGDVRVLHAVDPLPTNSPLRTLRNCILFATTGSRPEADKMSGGDLDGDQFLVIWDERILRHAGAISKENPENYDPPPRLATGKEDDLFWREDWISYAARFDSSLLGVVDSAFNAIAKERGVKSEEARELNRLFSDLVDKNPAKLRRLEELVGSCYIPGRGQRNGSVANGCIWEDMTEQQARCAARIRSSRSVPNSEDYSKFQSALDIPGKARLAEWIITQKDHLKSCVVTSSHMLNEIDSILLKSGMTFPFKESETVPNLNSADDMKDPQPLSAEFKMMCERWEQKADDIFADTMATWETDRQKILLHIQHLTKLKDEQLEMYEQERQELNQKHQEEWNSLQDLATKKDELKMKILQQRQNLMEVEEELGSLSYFAFFSQHRYSLLENKKKFEGDIKHLESSLSRMRDRIDILKRKLKKAKEAGLQDINDRQEDFITGKLRNDLLFEIDKKRGLIEFEQKILKPEKKKEKSLKKKIRDAEAEKEATATSQRINEETASKLENLCYILEKIEREGFFSSEMVSETSFVSLQNIGKKFKPWRMVYGKIEKVLIGISTEKKMQNRITGRNECPFELNSYFMHTKEASDILDAEAEAAKEKSSDLSHQNDRLEAESANMTNMQKQINRKLKASRKKEKKAGITEEAAHDLKKHIQELQLQKDKMGKDKIKIISELKERKKEKEDNERFASLCQTFKKSAELVLGELTFALPESPFLGLRTMFDDCAPELQQEFESLVLSGEQKHKNGSFVVSDQHLFKSYRDFTLEARIALTDQIETIEALIADQDQELVALEDELSCLRDDYAHVTRSCIQHSQKVRDLKRELEPELEQLENMFCADKMEALEQKWQETGLEDSMEIGRKNIDRSIEAAKFEWSKSCTNRDLNLRKLLAKLNEDVLRVCGIEENRVKGFLENGKCGKRKERLLVYEKRADLQRVLSKSNAIVVTAGTGCGKSTQIPQYIADDLTLPESQPSLHKSVEDNPFSASFQQLTRKVRICCTQPRRVAAQGISGRVAEEYKTAVGDLVGYRVGMRGGNAAEARKVSSDTRIEFVTEGWLLFHLTKSPESVSNYDCIIVDEAHERNKETDLLLALLRRHLEKEGTSPLKIVVMSASIDPQKFCEYFGDCPSIDCPGKLYEVKEYYCPADATENTVQSNGCISAAHVERVLFESVLDQIDEEGDVLIFLTGSKPIEECVEKINARAHKEKAQIVAYPLYAQMDKKDQDAATNKDHRSGIDGTVRKHQGYVRKVICCTNVAETSLTIDGVRFILEGGYAKKLRYDHVLRCSELGEEMISKASAKQRKGRAGRTTTGHCFYLYSREAHESMRDYDTPQILETPVHDLILFSLDVCGRSIEHLGLLDCPKPDDIRLAKQRLQDLGMIAYSSNGSEEHLTDDGELACRLSSFHPEGVRMVLAARELECFDRALKLAAIMSSEEDFFSKSFNSNEDDVFDDSWMRTHDFGDHLLALSLFEEFEKTGSKKMKGSAGKRLRAWCKDNGLIYHVMNRIQSTVESTYKEMKKRKLIVNCARKEVKDSKSDEKLLRACIAGYFGQVAECNEPNFRKGVRFTALQDRLGLLLAKESCLNNLAANSDPEYCFISDDELDEDNELDGDQSGQDAVQVSIHFVLFGSLLSIKTRTGNLLLMQNASLINGRWIADHAPKSWLDRVRFDPDRPSVCRETISSLGRPLLATIHPLLKREDFRLSDISTQVSWDTNKIRIYGSQEIVGFVKERILNVIEEKQQQLISSDSAFSFSDNQKIAFPQQVMSVFGAGMKLMSVKKKQDRSDIVDLSLWLSASRTVNCNKLEPPKNWKASQQQNGKIIFYVNRGWESVMFHDIILDVLKGGGMDCSENRKCRADEHIEHVALIEAGLSIGKILCDASDSEGSLLLIQEIYELAFDSSWTMILEKIGFMFLESGQFERALNALRGQPLSSVLMSDNIYNDVAEVLGVLGKKYSESADFLHSLDFFMWLVKLQKQKWGNNHQKVAAALQSRGEVLLMCGSFHKALADFEEALKIQLKLPNMTCLHSSEMKSHMGFAHFKLGQKEKGLELLQESLQVRQELDPDDELCADTMYRLGLVHQALLEFDKAVKYFDRSMIIRGKLEKTKAQQQKLQETMNEMITMAHSNHQYRKFLVTYEDKAKQLFPFGMYKLKVKTNVVEATPTHVTNRESQKLFFRALTNAAAHSLGMVGANSLPTTIFGLLEKFGMNNRPISSLWLKLWNDIKSEWKCESPFWRMFCCKLEEESPLPVSVIFIPSRSQFEIYSSQGYVAKHVKEMLLQKLVLMCVPPNYIEFYPPNKKYTRSQLWKITSVVDELKLKHPLVRFSIELNLSGDMSIRNKEVLVGSDVHTSKDPKEGSFVMTSNKDSMERNAFEQVEEAYRDGDHIVTLKVLLQSPSKSMALQKAHEELEKELSCSIEQATPAKHDCCCMCRRPVRMLQTQNNTKKDEKLAGKSWNDLHGWQLTLCGCIFCRQCFISSVGAKLKDNLAAQCRKCNTNILAKDCLKIVKPQNAGKQENDQFEKDWGYLSDLAISKFSAELTSLADTFGVASCPDCSTVTLCKSTKHFFFCRNSKCPNMMCSKCGRVPASTPAFQKCKSQNCL